MLKKILYSPLPLALQLLALVGTLDMLGTAIGLSLGVIEEANPFLNWFITLYGIPGFIAIKTFFIIWPIAVLAAVPHFMTETRRAEVGQTYNIIALVGYVVVLATGILIQLF